jgi:hypothetical protein
MITPKPKPDHAPFDGILRWLIESRTDLQAAYLVDLGGNKGWGLCTCRHFVTHTGPAIRKGATANLRYCWHVPEAKTRLAEWQIYIARNEDQNDEEE